ncbi:disulfide bond formation protein B [Candidatus Gracilibacteria bacterium]|nr:disulfide bond formation protein B [Candidatus Gracilibacteria bacterium]
MNLELYSTLVGIGVIILFILSLIILFNKSLKDKITLKIYYLFISIISGISIIGALTYEYIYYLDPCYYCWVERIFLFPLFLIGAISGIKNIEKNYFLIFIFSIIGLILTIYHTTLQYLSMFSIASVDTKCSLTGPSCVGNDGVEVFGFITIPAMGVLTFISILILTFIIRKKA